MLEGWRITIKVGNGKSCINRYRSCRNPKLRVWPKSAYRILAKRSYHGHRCCKVLGLRQTVCQSREKSRSPGHFHRTADLQDFPSSCVKTGHDTF